VTSWALTVIFGLVLAYIISIPCPGPIDECSSKKVFGGFVIFIVFMWSAIAVLGTFSYIGDGRMREMALLILERKLAPSKRQYLEIFPSACAECCSRNLEESYSVDYDSIVGFPDYSSNRYATYNTYTCHSCGTERREVDDGKNYDLAFNNAAPRAYLASSPYLWADEQERFPSYADCINKQMTGVLAENA
jgi:hypothetical protein